jgi:glycosyltransferase involved in cell wall biosynthesis
VDNDWFAEQSERRKRREADLRLSLGLPRRFFLYVGRFAREKNVDRLLEAHRRYRARTASEPWGLVVVGSGPETRRLEEQARRVGLGDVVIAGFRQIGELPAFYALASCLVLPSVSEPWGLVVNEAMASGLPVLVSERCGCVPELVQAGLNGYAFNPYSTDDLAHAMARMASRDVDLKGMGEESRRIIAAYTPDAWARSLSDCVAHVGLGAEGAVDGAR